MRIATPNNMNCPLSFNKLKRCKIQEVELFAVVDDADDVAVAVADGKLVL